MKPETPDHGENDCQRGQDLTCGERCACKLLRRRGHRRVFGCLPPAGDERELGLTEWVNRPRSDLPAITHVDHSARVQTVASRTNPRYHELILAFEELTGCAVLINTSFNVRGEPIVCTPEDATRCFLRTEMDCLVLGPYLLHKEAQAAAQSDSSESSDWSREFPLD